MKKSERAEKGKIEVKVAFHTLGCKVNQYETEALCLQFKNRGYEVVGDTDYADVYVINTCTVTGLADRKSRQYIRKMKKRNPESVIAVTGCYAQISPDAVSYTHLGKVSYKVPAGTQPNTVFRLKNKGINSIRSSRKGDLYVRVILEVPTKLNGKQKKAIHNMAKEVNHDCYHKKSGFLDAMKEFFS